MPTSVTYPLVSVSVAQAAQALQEGAGQPPFLRRGVVIPFRRDQKNDFANGVSVELIRGNVRQILGTKGPTDRSAGEIPWLTEFGSIVHKLRHQNNREVLRELALVYVVDALRRWEPRVRVTQVDVRRLPRTLDISVRFNVVDANGAGTTILVPNVTETISLAA